MRAVLADLALESEANTALVFRLARAWQAAHADPLEAAYARLMTPAAKYLVTKTAPSFIYETLECLGGNGYVEDFPMARLYREAPLNAIWEGSGNVMTLDILRIAKGQRGGDGRDRRAGLGLRRRRAERRRIRSRNSRAAKTPSAERASSPRSWRGSARSPRSARPTARSRKPTAAARLSGEPHTTWGACDLGAAEGLVLGRVLAE